MCVCECICGAAYHCLLLLPFASASEVCCCRCCRCLIPKQQVPLLPLSAARRLLLQMRRPLRPLLLPLLLPAAWPQEVYCGCYYSRSLCSRFHVTCFRQT